MAQMLGRGARAARRALRQPRRWASQAKLGVCERHPWYASLVSEDVSAFRGITSSVLEGEEACLPYNVDWMNKWEGRSRVVVRPESTAEVSAILAYCNEQGGKRGLHCHLNSSFER